MNFDQTDKTHTRPSRELPAFYYHAHFLEMLSFVCDHYGHVIAGQPLGFIDEFRALGKPAQCLYVRLVNRKGRVFSRRRLRYPEIGHLGNALEVLLAAGFVGPPDQSHFDDLVRFLNKSELTDLLAMDCTGLSRSLRKPEYVEFALKHADRSLFLDRLDTSQLFVQRRLDVVEYLLFLYFGRLPDGLAQFTMRDLGLTRTQNFSDRYEPRFEEREEAEEHFFYCRKLRRLNGASGPVTNARMLEDSAGWPEPVYPGGAKLRDELALKLGRRLERGDDLTGALAAYAIGESAECRERRVRLLLKNGNRECARRLLESCIQNPAGDDELLFARDLYERKFAGKRTSETTDLLRSAETIELDESSMGAVEQAAADWFESQGHRAFRVENTLWRTLFGLLFWDEIFGSEHPERSSPFEWLPPSLSDGGFYRRHRDSVEAKLGRLADRGWLRKCLLQASTRHYGRRNGMFRWRRTTLEAVFQMLDHLDTGLLAAPLRRLAQRYDDSRHGYPDLLVIDDSGARFVEIKTEGDLIRKNQHLRIDQLRDAGLRADVLRVRWIVDPLQTYVVVDVETTGGRGDQHRITEIGAVKLKNGKIIDRFHSLLNPQRSIPGSIIRLTGITPEMVAGAPTFAEIADDFESFMGDAIFVAHNVGFDYRFVSGEFARLGRTFRRAKLCTWTGMRKLYPGHRSYSLAALCAIYDIPLRQHHRALCDAEAAAQLMILINERRQAQVTGGAVRSSARGLTA